MPGRTDPSSTDWYPPAIFLALLDTDIAYTPDTLYADQIAFFGNGSAATPQAVLEVRHSLNFSLCVR